MGKSIYQNRVSSSSTSTTVNNIVYSYPEAILDVRESDSDPLHLVEIALIVMVTVKSTDSTSRTTPQGIVTATFTDSQSVSRTVESAQYTATPSASPKNTQMIIKAIERGSVAQHMSGTLTVSGRHSLTSFPLEKSISIGFDIPPLKQNITDENCRITFTIDGVKHDILNYK